MKKKLQCFLVVMLMAVISLTPASAQKTMDVMKFSRMDNDLMARVTKPVRDQDEGKLCALIRVVTKLTDLEVRADALGIVKKEEHKGELWLYVPYGAKSLSFSHEDYFPLMYQYPLSIDEGTVYELQLGSYETDVDGNNRNLNTQMFVLTHQPDDATIYIDDMEVESEFGVFAAMMSKGEHKYKVTAPQYEEVEGAFELADMPVRETVNMQPLFGIFQLFTLPENGFNVFVDGRQVGTSPYKSERLDPGAYRIRIEKDKYYPVDTLIRLREGDELQFTCRLEVTTQTEGEGVGFDLRDVDDGAVEVADIAALAGDDVGIEVGNPSVFAGIGGIDTLLGGSTSLPVVARVGIAACRGIPHICTFKVVVEHKHNLVESVVLIVERIVVLDGIVFERRRNSEIGDT